MTRRRLLALAACSLGALLLGSTAASAIDDAPGMRVAVLDGDAGDLLASGVASEPTCSGWGIALLTDPMDAVPASAEHFPRGTPIDDLAKSGAAIIAVSGEPGSTDELGAVAVQAPVLAQDGCRVLTSDSTRRIGVLSPSDVGTIARQGDFLSVRAVPAAPDTVQESYSRYLRQRRMYVPVAIVAGIFTGIAIIGGLLIYFKRQRLPRWLLAVGRWVCFAIPALGLALLAAGHLPNLSYASVTPFLVAVTLFLPALVLAFRRRGTLAPPLVFGISILAFFVIEALTGWYATMFTLLGGTALDGGRFYGLPNAFEGLLVGSAVYVAASLKPWLGFAVIVAVALFMGLPWFGADLGGAVVALVAAGLWFSLRVRGRFGWKEAGLTFLTVVAGMAVVLAAHRIFAPTHATAFVEAEARSPFHILSVAWDRLAVGLRLLQRNPVGILYLAATPVLLWLVARPRGGLKVAFDENPVWRFAMLTLLWATVVAYFVNDTGVSAVGLSFAMALGGTIYVPLAREPAKMVPL